MVSAFHFAFVFEFELAGDGRQRGIHVADTRDRNLLAMSKGSALGIGDDVLHTRNWEALADAGTLVYFLVLACGEGDAFDHFAHVLGNDQLVSVTRRPGFLRGDRDAFFNRGGIMRANLRADAIFERRNDLSARCVVLRIRREYERDIERQADGIALNLNVAFLHDVKEANLNFSGKIGQFVDGEDAAIGARQ